MSHEPVKVTTDPEEPGKAPEGKKSSGHHGRFFWYNMLFLMMAVFFVAIWALPKAFRSNRTSPEAVTEDLVAARKALENALKELEDERKLRASVPPPVSAQIAPAEGPPAAKSEGVNLFDVDVPRGVSDVLSAPVNWLNSLPEISFGRASEPPRPPGKVYELWVRPGVVVWEGVISRSQPSPWFEVKETVFRFIDTNGEGSQGREFYPGNVNIFRWVEKESHAPLAARVYGETPP